MKRARDFTDLKEIEMIEGGGFTDPLENPLVSEETRITYRGKDLLK